ncbi:family 16 glycoside hydrolase, partial [Nitrolancea hollandica]|uniref:family 16 glycoside hydrolase n=1 Tax=Nitrolancea hollandica TaxID=1206749 RepID=UPI000684D50A
MAARSRLLLCLLLLTTSLIVAGPAGAASIGNDAYQRTWDRTDKPVAAQQVSRTWMWGPQANTDVMNEPYIDAGGGQRQVQYFDKSRMEINNPNGDQNSIWYVTNGLLVRELITGTMAVGDNTYEQRRAAEINASGDPDDPNAPTYATFNGLLNAPALALNAPVTQRLDRNGNVTDDPGLSGQNVTVATVDDNTHHSIANVFWDFMNSSGIVWENGNYVNAPLFQNPFFATGRPITEPYWVNVKVAGTQRDVLLQCFERRCLTYNPANADGWKVEAGNVGQHYYNWRYISGVPADGPVLYHSALTDWVAFNQNGDSGAVAGGTYHITAANQRFPRIKAHDLNFTDSTVSVAVRMVSQSQKAGACLFTRLVGADTAHYALCMAADGKAQASYDYFDAQNNPQTQVLLEAKQYGGTLPANQWNTLKITAKGNSLWFFINGVLMGTATAPSGGPANGN